MTCTYDGRLVVTKGGIQPCCADLHDAIYAGVVYKGTSSKAPAVAIRLGDKRGRAIRFCPFCGARPEGAI